jgi:hypothetical protein
VICIVLLLSCVVKLIVWLAALPVAAIATRLPVPVSMPLRVIMVGLLLRFAGAFEDRN